MRPSFKGYLYATLSLIVLAAAVCAIPPLAAYQNPVGWMFLGTCAGAMIAPVAVLPVMSDRASGASTIARVARSAANPAIAAAPNGSAGSSLTFASGKRSRRPVQLQPGTGRSGAVHGHLLQAG